MNTLNDARVSAVIERLHAAAANDGDRWSRRRACGSGQDHPTPRKVGHSSRAVRTGSLCLDTEDSPIRPVVRFVSGE